MDDGGEILDFPPHSPCWLGNDDRSGNFGNDADGQSADATVSNVRVTIRFVLGSLDMDLGKTCEARGNT